MMERRQIKGIVYFMVAASLFPVEALSFDLTIMNLSLFRMSIFLLAFFMMFEYIKGNQSIAMNTKTNQGVIILFYFIWVCYCFLSFFWVKDHYSWLRTNYFMLNAFLGIWILSEYLKTIRDFRRVFLIMFGMIILHNLIGWSELLTGHYQFADLTTIDFRNEFAVNPAARVPISIFANPNDYATLLVLGIFVTYIIFLTSSGKAVKIAGTVTVLSSVLLLYRTGSRANLIGLAAGVSALLYTRYLRKSKWFKMILIGSGILLLFYLFHIVSTKVPSGSNLTRLNLIKNGLFFLKETYGFGTGAGNIEYWMRTRSLYDVGTIQNMHNWWMEILTSQGVLIFAAYVYIYFKKIRILFSSSTTAEDSFIRNTSFGFLGALSAFIFSSISSSSNMGMEWLWIFWAMIIAYIGLLESKHTIGESERGFR